MLSKIQNSGKIEQKLILMNFCGRRLMSLKKFKNCEFKEMFNIENIGPHSLSTSKVLHSV